MDKTIKFQLFIVVFLFCALVYLLFWGATADRPLAGKVIGIQYHPGGATGGGRAGVVGSSYYSVTIEAKNGLTNVLKISRIEAETLKIGDFYSRENGFFQESNF